jgi:hypothetical protein
MTSAHAQTPVMSPIAWTVFLISHMEHVFWATGPNRATTECMKKHIGPEAALACLEQGIESAADSQLTESKREISQG